MTTASITKYTPPAQHKTILLNEIAELGRKHSIVIDEVHNEEQKKVQLIIDNKKLVEENSKVSLMKYEIIINTKKRNDLLSEVESEKSLLVSLKNEQKEITDVINATKLQHENIISAHEEKNIVMNSQMISLLEKIGSLKNDIADIKKTKKESLNELKGIHDDIEIAKIELNSFNLLISKSKNELKQTEKIAIKIKDEQDKKTASFESELKERLNDLESKEKEFETRSGTLSERESLLDDREHDLNDRKSAMEAKYGHKIMS